MVEQLMLYDVCGTLRLIVVLLFPIGPRGRRGKKRLLLTDTPFLSETDSPYDDRRDSDRFFFVTSATSPGLSANLNAASVALTMTLSRSGGSSRNQSICSFFFIRIPLASFSFSW